MTDNIIKIGLEKVGIEYGLRYYQEMYKIMKNPDKDIENDFLDISLEMIKKGHKFIYEEINKSIIDLNLIYLEICKNNLAPVSEVFTITEPVSFRKLSSLSIKKLMLYAVFGWIILEIIIISWIYIKNQAIE